MKLPILWLIRLYQAFPDKYKRTCIFQESCSRVTYRVIEQEGIVAGYRVFAIRQRQCKPIKGVQFGDEGISVELADGSITNASTLREDAYLPYLQSLQSLLTKNAHN